MRLPRIFSTFCRTYNPANGLAPAGSKISSTLAAMSAAGLILASTGLGSVYAWTAGAPHGPLMASLMALMACGLEVAKPLAVASALSAFRRFAIVRGAAMALLAVVAVAYSLTAELSLMAMGRGDLAAQRAADARTAKSIDGRRDRIEAELSKLANVRPAATVRAEIGGLLADLRVGDCKVMDGPRSKSACPRIALLRSELGNAERKERLEADLANLQAPGAAATDRQADPGAAALATYLTTIGIVLPDRLLTEWMVLVGVVALELGSALAVLLAQTVSGLQTGHETPRQAELNTERQAQTQPATPQTVSTPAKPGRNDPDPDAPPPNKRTPKRQAKRTQRNARRRLGNVVRLVQANGGKVTTSQQSMARELRLSKTRVNELLRELEAVGKVQLHTSRAGTTVALVA